jgi:CRISPR-associated endonuclease/helicase Cas3
LVADPIEGPRDEFSRRMGKEHARTHHGEALSKLEEPHRSRIAALLSDEALTTSFTERLRQIVRSSPKHEAITHFQFGLLIRFLFSCLIDADREDTADFERPHAAENRQHGQFTPWQVLAERLDRDLEERQPQHPIDRVRQEISHQCLQAASRPRGIFTLTVPTGGGKTLASLRFALHHAKLHNLDRVVYVVPFTTIIDQNADVARKILEPATHPDDAGRLVLEHHSNLDPLRYSWKNKVLADNWDAPVVYTTSVQFLEAVLGGGTRGVRRMHQLARSVIIFDEIQSLPIRCVHLFNNTINFLVDQCGSTVVLCTATQPLLGQVDPSKGAARITTQSEIVTDVEGTFAKLRRVEVKDARRPGGWTNQAVADLARSEVARTASCLIVVNTKKSARAVFQALSDTDVPLFHLSTSMCPAHRKASFAQIRGRLAREERVLCVSTQLIEAGVDVDFGSVIRFAAGLDSVAQAAGRCNRNGRRSMGVVYVVNPAEENLSSLPDIKIAREKAETVFDDFRTSPASFDNDLLSPKAMNWFYENYFFERRREMVYPVDHDCLLDMLSTNRAVVSAFRNKVPNILFRQSFKAAGDAFKAIDAPTTSVIVPYGKEGRDLMAELCAAHDVETQFHLLRAAQQFTVNIFQHEFSKLESAHAIHEVQPGTGIHYLNEGYYSRDFGLSTEPVSPEEFLYVE